MSENAELYAALAKAQGEFPAIPRSKPVKVTTRRVGEYTFWYSPLEIIRELTQPILSANGLAVSQNIMLKENGREYVFTHIGHTSGESLDLAPVLITVPDEVDDKGFKRQPTAQEVGSGLTYARRYSLTLALNLATEEDDDGNAASGNSAELLTESKRPSAPACAQSTFKEPGADREPVIAAGVIEEFIPDTKSGNLVWETKTGKHLFKMHLGCDYGRILVVIWHETAKAMAEAVQAKTMSTGDKVRIDGRWVRNEYRGAVSMEIHTETMPVDDSEIPF